MNENITKEDLKQFGTSMMANLREMIHEALPLNKNENGPQWLKSKVVRKLLDISPGSLQSLRVTGKMRFKKILGSYYYNKEDIEKLFNE
ncbi:MAG: helix-turn-helix domain-containing protein [Bacteroidia bacterium]